MKGKQNYFFPVLFLCTVVQWCGEKRQSRLFWYNLSVPGRAVGKGLYFWNRGQKNFVGMHLFWGRHSHFRPETWRCGVHSYRDQHWGRSWAVSFCPPAPELSWCCYGRRGSSHPWGLHVYSNGFVWCPGASPETALLAGSLPFLTCAEDTELLFRWNQSFQKVSWIIFFFSKICRKSRKLHSFIMHASELISLWICYKLAGKLMASRVAAYPTWV